MLQRVILKGCKLEMPNSAPLQGTIELVQLIGETTMQEHLECSIEDISLCNCFCLLAVYHLNTERPYFRLSRSAIALTSPHIDTRRHCSFRLSCAACSSGVPYFLEPPGLGRVGWRHCQNPICLMFP